MVGVSLPLAMTLAGGSWIFLGYEVFMFLVVAYGFYTLNGSGISQHPYGNVYGGAPAAKTPSDISGRDHASNIRHWTRGTR